MLGREQETTLAGEVARSSEVLEFSGEPGVGKTALLRSVAEHADPEGPPVIKVAHAPVDDVLPALARRFWDSGGEHWVATPELCEELLAEVKAILVLDQPPFSEDELHTLLDAAPGCAVILTSRRRITGSKGPRFQSLRGLAPEVAVGLFQARLDRELDGDVRAQALELCRFLDGFPWHIEQAALLVQEQKTTLDDLFAATRAVQAGEGAKRWVADRVAALLDDAQRRVIDVLEHFGCPVHVRHFGVLAQIANPSEVLASLKRLGVVESMSPVFRLCEGRLPTQAGRQRFKPGDEAMEYLAGWAHERRNRPDELLEDAALLARAVDLGAQERRHARAAVRIALALEGALASDGAWTTWGVVLRSGRAAARRCGDVRAEALFLHELGCRAVCLGDRRRAVRNLRRAHALRERSGDAAGSAATAANMQLVGARPGRRWRPRATMPSRQARSDPVPTVLPARPSPGRPVGGAAAARRWTVVAPAAAAALAAAVVMPGLLTTGDDPGMRVGDAEPPPRSLSASARFERILPGVARVTLENQSSQALVLASAAEPTAGGRDDPNVILNRCRRGRRLAAGATCSIVLRIGRARTAPDELLLETSSGASVAVPVSGTPPP